MLDSYDNLQIALNVAKGNLKTLNDRLGNQFRCEINILRQISWVFMYFAFRDNNRKRLRDNVKAGGEDMQPTIHITNNFHNAKRQRQQQQQHSERTNVFSRLAAGSVLPNYDDDDMEGAVVRPARLSSRVYKEIPSREEVVAAQGSDAQSRARNKRMFGSLLGTLSKFCQEESRLKPKVEKKAQIDKKVEEQEIRERETMKQERKNLFIDRKKQQMEIRLLEIKMNRMADLTLWEEAHQSMRSFIATKCSKPRIYYKPKVMSERSNELLAESQRVHDKRVAEKREQVQQELAELEEKFKQQLNKAIEDKTLTANNDNDCHLNELLDQVQNSYNERGTGSRKAAIDVESEEEEDDDEEKGIGNPNLNMSCVIIYNLCFTDSRPKIGSLVVKTKVDVPIKVEGKPPSSVIISRNPRSGGVRGGSTDSATGSRHVLHSDANKKMIISVVNNSYENNGRR